MNFNSIKNSLSDNFSSIFCQLEQAKASLVKRLELTKNEIKIKTIFIQEKFNSIFHKNQDKAQASKSSKTKIKAIYDCISLKNNRIKIVTVYKQAIDSIQRNKDEMVSKCQRTAHAIVAFIAKNKDVLFLFGCSATTAFFSPELFFPAFIITIIVRVAGTQALEKLAYKVLKEKYNPFAKEPSVNDRPVGILGLTLASIGAIDSLALGTIFYSKSRTIKSLPILTGIIAGNSTAKIVLHVFKTKNKQEI